MGLIKDNVNEKLNEIVKKCFEGNRILDRMVNQLDLKFVMTSTSKLMHQKIAHAYPNPLADSVSEYQGDRNNDTVYGETFKDATEYASPYEIFSKFIGFQMELEQLIYESIDMAIEEYDYMTQTFLQSFLVSIKPFTKQALLFKDKADKYNGEWMHFDDNVERFFIL